MAAPVHPYSDYGVALRTLKSARSWLGLLLVLCVLTQFIGFALFWWTPQPYKSGRPGQSAVEETDASVADRVRKHIRTPIITPATEPATSTSQPETAPAVEEAPAENAALRNEPVFTTSLEGRRLNVRQQWDITYSIVVPVTQFFGLIAAASQVILVFLSLLLILVAQAPGVAQVTRSLIWATLLLFMVLPWQYFARNIPIPGTLFGYTEMLALIAPHVTPGAQSYRFHLFLVFARFTIWPAIALLVLLISSERYRAGIMLAIGHPLQSLMQPRSPMPPSTRPAPEKHP